MQDKNIVRRNASEATMWKEMYLILFQAASEAIQQMQMRHFGFAITTLKDAQCKAEEQFISWNEEEQLKMRK